MLPGNGHESVDVQKRGKVRSFSDDDRLRKDISGNGYYESVPRIPVRLISCGVLGDYAILAPPQFADQLCYLIGVQFLNFVLVQSTVQGKWLLPLFRRFPRGLQSEVGAHLFLRNICPMVSLKKRQAAA